MIDDRIDGSIGQCPIRLRVPIEGAIDGRRTILPNEGTARQGRWRGSRRRARCVGRSERSCCPSSSLLPAYAVSQRELACAVTICPDLICTPTRDPTSVAAGHLQHLVTAPNRGPGPCGSLAFNCGLRRKTLKPYRGVPKPARIIRYPLHSNVKVAVSLVTSPFGVIVM